MLRVYSRNNCERCARTKKMLSDRGLEYQELIIGEQVTREEVLSLFPDAKQVPIVTRDGYQVKVEEL